MNKFLAWTTALCLGAAALPAAAQLDLEGRQYIGVSVFGWDSEATRQRVEAGLVGNDTVTGFIEETRGDANAMGVRLLAGVRLTEWLGAELHMAAGGSVGSACGLSRPT
jgi:hypothetical protein